MLQIMDARTGRQDEADDSVVDEARTLAETITAKRDRLLASLTLIAGIGHWVMGSVDLLLMMSLLVGSIPGIIVGSMLGSRASDSLLRPVLAVTLLIVSTKLLMS